MTAIELDRFEELTQSANWASIDEIKDLLDKGDYWDDEFEESALDFAKKAFIRRRIKNIKDPSGFPLFASVVTRDADGIEERRYKQEPLFEHEDYRQVITYHADRAHHHVLMAQGYQARDYSRFGELIQLPFDILEGPDNPAAV